MKKALYFLIPLWLSADTATWTKDGGGVWNFDGNWTAPYPNSATDQAFFPELPSPTIQIVVDISNITVNSLIFQSTTTAYTIVPGTPGDTITFAGTSPSIQLLSGPGYTITVPFVMPPSGISIITSPGTTSTIDDEISGPSAFVKEGSGTLVLAGTNTYTGGTVLQSGTISISADDNLGDPSGNFTFEGSGTLTATNSLTTSRKILLNSPGTIEVTGVNVFTINGDIDGISTLSKAGGGTLVLDGENSYSGGTIVQAGKLQGNTTSLQNPILNDATLEFNQTTDGTFTSPISGSGLLSKTGGGALALKASNTYSGGTTVSAGTLEGDTTSLQGDIANTATVVFDQAVDGKYLGSLSGSGTLVKKGLGTISLDALSNVQNDTTIDTGKILVMGELESSVLVQKPGIIGGTGTVRGNLVSKGKIAAAASIGTLNVVGDVTIDADSSVEAEFNSSEADLINVVGAVNIVPGATLELVPLGILSTANTLPIVQSTVGITGTFSTITPLPPLLNVSVIYNPNTILLDILFFPFTTLVSTGNAGIVAAYLDNQCQDPTGDFACVISSLRLAPDSDALTSYLNELHPALYSGFSLIQENLVIRMNALYQERLPCCGGFWFGFLGDFTKQGAIKDYIAEGYRSATEGFALGWDRRCGNALFGISGAFAYTDISWKYHLATGNEWDLFLTLYGSLYDLFELSLLGGYGHAYGSRKIDFQAIHREARHNHDDWIWDIHGRFYWPLDWCKFRVTPYVELDFVNDYQSHFKESGADSINLKVKSKYANLLRPEVGIDFLWNNLLEGSVAYVYEARFSGKKISAKMEGANGYFTVHGLNPNRSLLAYDIALYFKTPTAYLSLGYGGELSHHYRDQHITVKAQRCF